MHTRTVSNSLVLCKLLGAKCQQSQGLPLIGCVTYIRSTLLAVALAAPCHTGTSSPVLAAQLGA